MAKRARKISTCPENCGAVCCNYIVKKLDPPRSKVDWDELYWFLAHEKVAVYIEQRKWYLMLDVPCKHLTARSRCRVYETRPIVCRLHSEENCEYTGDVEFQAFMTSPEDLVRLMKKRGISYKMPWQGTREDTGRKGGARGLFGGGGRRVGERTQGRESAKGKAA